MKKPARTTEHVCIGGVDVSIASRTQLVEIVLQPCAHSPNDKPKLLFDTNGHAISLAATDSSFSSALEHADIIHADGASVVAASRFLTPKVISERSATTDLIHDLARRCEAIGQSFYLLGGTEQVNAEAAAILAKLYPELRIAGRHHGFFSEDEVESVLTSIAQANPDILWVGMGKPREQLFSIRHQEEISAKWIITCGGCFNFISGHYRRAPKWVQAIGMEWLWRALTSPRTLLWRYLTTTPHAVWLMVRHRALS